MIIGKKWKDDTVTFVLEGKLSVTSAPELQETVIPAFDVAKEVILDFTKVAYVSSAGLRVLLVGQETAEEKDAEMILTGVSDEIVEVFEMTGFAEILKIRG